MNFSTKEVCESLGLPILVKGQTIEFDRKINFGSFKAATFVYVGFYQHKFHFRVGTEEGRLVQILPTVLMVESWHVLTDASSVLESVPVLPPSAAIEITYDVLADGQLVMF